MKSVMQEVPFAWQVQQQAGVQRQAGVQQQAGVLQHLREGQQLQQQVVEEELQRER